MLMVCPCAEIIGGETSDYKGFDILVDDEMPTDEVFIAYKGCDFDTIRDMVISRGGRPVIPARSNRKAQILIDRFVYTLRNRIER